MSLAEMAELTRGKPRFFSMRSFSGKAVSPALGSQKLSSSSARVLGALQAGGCGFSKIPGREGSCNPFKTHKQLLASLVGIRGCLSSRWLHLRNLSILTVKCHRKFMVSFPGKWTHLFCQKNAQWKAFSINLVHFYWVSECQEILPDSGPEHKFGPKISHKSPLVPVCTWKTGVGFLKWVYSFSHSYPFPFIWTA